MGVNDRVLSLHDLVVEVPGRVASLRPVDRVSLDISAGEILGVVGESGAGKSMLGSAVIGLPPPPARIAGGEIWLNGQRIDGLPPAQMRLKRGCEVGMIFQDPMGALDPLMTIGAQLVETIRAHMDISRAAARQRAIAALQEVGIPDPAERLRSYPHQFSGGMRQRVVIALALCGMPSLVVADEPTTALDVSVQAQIVALLKRLCRDRRMAVMLITHDMGVIADAADRVAVMYAGRVVERGVARAVLTAPRHPYTAALMASAPSLSVAGDRLAQIPGAMPRPEALPGGCRFHPRCARARPECRSGAEPDLAADHGRAACRYPVPTTPEDGA